MALKIKKVIKSLDSLDCNWWALEKGKDYGYILTIDFPTTDKYEHETFYFTGKTLKSCLMDYVEYLTSCNGF